MVKIRKVLDDLTGQSEAREQAKKKLQYLLKRPT